MVMGTDSCGSNSRLQATGASRPFHGAPAPEPSVSQTDRMSTSQGRPVDSTIARIRSGRFDLWMALALMIIAAPAAAWFLSIESIVGLLLAIVAHVAGILIFIRVITTHCPSCGRLFSSVFRLPQRRVDCRQGYLSSRRVPRAFIVGFIHD